VALHFVGIAHGPPEPLNQLRGKVIALESVTLIRSRSMTALSSRSVGWSANTMM